MAFHRIKKYSRQIVCQDCVLSCQPNHIEEIPLLKNAQVNSVSLQNHKARSGEERSTLLERDLDLSGMLMCWHLWNSRGMPLSTKKRRVENHRRRGTEKRERLCQSLLTLRGQVLYMAIEKYFLFLMPREVKRKRVIHSLNKLLSRQDRVCFSAFYVYTALGLCQYKLKDTPLQMALLDAGAKLRFAQAGSYQKEKDIQLISSLALSAERMVFPFVQARVLQTENKMDTKQRFALKDSVQSLASHMHAKSNATHTVSCKTSFCKATKHIALQHNRSRGLPEKALSLHCPSVLFSPDIQDIAQSGIPLEGSLTLELS